MFQSETANTLGKSFFFSDDHLTLNWTFFFRCLKSLRFLIFIRHFHFSSSYESFILTLKNTSYKELFDLNDALMNTSIQHQLEKQWNTLWNNYIDIIMEKNKLRHCVIPKRNKRFEKLYEDTKLAGSLSNS